MAGKVIKRIAQAAPFAMILLMVILYFKELRGMTLEELLEYTPSEPLAAALVLILMFGLKSLSFFFPMMLLYAASGAVLPIYAAIPVSLAGTAVMASIPFFVGKYAESELVDKLAGKHNKLEQVKAIGREHELFGAFFLRIISCLPYDAVSMIMGSMRFNYGKYLLGSFLGTAPGAVLTTIMGESVDDPLSPMFLACAGADIVIAAGSAVAYRSYLKRKKRTDED